MGCWVEVELVDCRWKDNIWIKFSFVGTKFPNLLLWEIKCVLTLYISEVLSTSSEELVGMMVFHFSSYFVIANFCVNSLWTCTKFLLEFLQRSERFLFHSMFLWWQSMFPLCYILVKFKLLLHATKLKY